MLQRPSWLGWGELWEGLRALFSFFLSFSFSFSFFLYPAVRACWREGGGDASETEREREREMEGMNK